MKKRNWILLIILIFIFGIGITVSADNSCEGLFGPKLIGEVRDIFKFIQIAAPVILLVLTSIDFIKVVFGDNKDGMDKAKNNFLKRAVAVLIIFFAPMIITLVMELVDDISIRNAANCINPIKN